MSLDATNLSILEIAGTPQQKHYASRIIPIRKNGHILLATLLLTNTVLNETLPILFDDIFSKGILFFSFEQSGGFVIVIKNK